MDTTVSRIHVDVVISKHFLIFKESNMNEKPKEDYASSDSSDSDDDNEDEAAGKGGAPADQRKSKRKFVNAKPISTNKTKDKSFWTSFVDGMFFRF